MAVTKGANTVNRKPWQPMDSAPKGRKVRVKLKSGQILDAHFAQDLSGEEQPPFKGWFKQRSTEHPEYGYVQIDDPVAWKPVDVSRSAPEAEKE